MIPSVEMHACAAVEKLFTSKPNLKQKVDRMNYILNQF